MASREASAAPSSGDTVDEQVDDSRLAPTEVDETLSDLHHLSDTPVSTAKPSRRGRGAGVKKPRPKKGTHVWVNEGLPDGTEDESVASVRIKKSGSPDPDGKNSSAAVGTRRQANGTVGSVYSGSKIRHIKKPDGQPLWRKEIQFNFLEKVVEDDKEVFTRVGDGKKATFAEIYIDCMARSSKTSKILKDRLQVDKPAAKNMAMICLLVNVGRMNTTLNFFPEMRAQLRTYHPIPSLQSHDHQKDYKSLQDAPRLKSILKGASEDTEEPRSLPQMKSLPVPRTNAVNLIFLLSQAASEIAQLHFTDKVDFFDLAMRSTISSESRARAFLWLMWYYLESDFTKKAALENPYGPGQYKDEQDSNDPNELPLLVPDLVTITDEEGDLENVDPEEELKWGERMTKERERINEQFAQEDAYAAASGRDIEHKGVKRLKRSARDLGDDDSDVDSRASPGAVGRSPGPGDGVSALGTLQADSLEDDWEPVEAHPGRGRYKRVRGKNTPTRSKIRTSEMGMSAGRGGGRSRLGFSDRGTPDTNRGTPQPLPPGVGNHPIISQFGGHRSRHDTDLLASAAGSSLLSGSGMGGKSRARTGYQRELEEHRMRRIEWLLARKRREEHQKSRVIRERNSWLLKAAKRITELPATYDSEEEEENFTAFFTNDVTKNVPFIIGLGGIIGKRYTNQEVSKTDGVVKTEDEDDEGAGDAQTQNKELDATSKAKILSKQGVDPRKEDWGEEALHWTKLLQRANRRLDTWSAERELNPRRKRREKFDALGGFAEAYRNGLGGESIAPSLAMAASSETKHHRSGPGRGRGRGRGGQSRSSMLAAGSHRRQGGRGGSRSGAALTGRSSGARKTGQSLDDEITQDLLAERSADEDDEDEAEEDGDDEEGDVDEEGDDDRDGDVDADGDLNMTREDEADEEADGDDDGDRHDASDVDMS